MEKISLLEKENFALKSQIEFLQSTISYERTRGEKTEEIYMKRLGVISQSGGNGQQAPNPIKRGMTAQELGRAMSRRIAIQTRAIQEYWKKKLEEQEKAKAQKAGQEVVEEQTKREPTT
jgi:Mn-containing catalase